MTVPRLRLIAGRYFWRPTKAVKALGYHAEPLGADPIKAAERARYLNSQVALTIAGLEPSVPAEGSLAALIRSYEETDAYKGLRATTRRQYDSTLRQIRKAAAMSWSPAYRPTTWKRLSR